MKNVTTLKIEPEMPPIHLDEHGTARICGTRLTLDSVVALFDQGETPAQIAEAFPPFDMADVHAVLSYVLRHRAEVDAYLADQERQAEEVRKRIAPIVAPRKKLDALRARWEEMQKSRSAS